MIYICLPIGKLAHYSELDISNYHWITLILELLLFSKSFCVHYSISHLVKAAIEESADLRMVKGQFLHLSPVVKTEVHQMLRSSCGRYSLVTFISCIKLWGS